MTKKFRFYDKKYKQWRELPDLLGDYQAHAFRTYGEGFELRHFLNADAQEKILSGDLVIQQFTGLIDKNDREIYEGDIINLKCRINISQLVVKFGNYYESEGMADNWAHLGYFLESADGECYSSIADINTEDMEVIGNIFENPLDNLQNNN